MFDMQPIKEEITIQGFNSIYYFELGKDFTHEPEAHDFWEMVYVDNGNIYAITDGVGCNLSQGQVIFHKPMELHAHISDKKAPNNMLVVAFTARGEAMPHGAFSRISISPAATLRARCTVPALLITGSAILK